MNDAPLLPFVLPEALPALVLAPLAWLALRALDRARTRRLRRAVGPRVAVLAADLATARRRLRNALVAGGLLCALVAVTQPAWGIDEEKVEQRGVDLIACLDVSRSMLARDLPPSRLERAKRELRALAERVRGDRLGLVVFAGEAHLQVPLTRDVDSFAELVAATDTLSVQRGGTDLGAALETAMEALGGRSGQHEVLILITDGEDHEQRGLRAAEACRDLGIAVHCVGLGTELGSKITVPSGAGQAFLRDSSGEEVVTALDAAGLRRIAETTGGSFVDAAASPRPLVELYETRVLPMARKAFDADPRRERENHYQWPLLAAFLLWMLELCLSDRRPSETRPTRFRQ